MAAAKGQRTSFYKIDLPANVFSNFDLSSYLVWGLGDQYPDFADGRYIPFGPRLFDQQRTLTSLPLDSTEWTQAAATYHLNTIIFPLSRIFALGEFPLLADCESTLDAGLHGCLRHHFSKERRRNHGRQIGVDCHTQNLLPPEKLSLNSSRLRAEQYQKLANASAIPSGLLGRLSEAREAADRAPGYLLQRHDTSFYQSADCNQCTATRGGRTRLRKALAIKQTDAGW